MNYNSFYEFSELHWTMRNNKEEKAYFITPRLTHHRSPNSWLAAGVGTWKATSGQYIDLWGKESDFEGKLTVRVTSSTHVPTGDSLFNIYAPRKH